MSKTAFLLVFTGILFSASASQAQAKTGCISMSELLTAMPEMKKADSALEQYRAALEQQFRDFQMEYSEKAAKLSSADTARFTPPQRDLQRRSLAELLARIQGYDQEAGTLFNHKKLDLLSPIQKKAEDAIRQVSQENGYAFVFEKETLHIYPPSADILPLVKKKLGL